MRCVRCGRALLAPTVTIPTQTSALGYGPVCARKAGLIEPRQPARQRVTTAHRNAWQDPAQMELETAQ